MSTDNREDYLINILRLTNGSDTVKTTDIAKYMNVAPASVTEMLKVLSKDGLVNYERYRGVSLTEEGKRVARNLRRKHHIMERFLMDVLNVNSEAAHEGACAFEHSMSDEAAVRMCHLIGTKVDGDCETCPDPCDDMTGVTTISSRISDMEIGKAAIITHVKHNDMDSLKRFISMGLVPGKDISLESKETGAYIVRIDGSAMAIDPETAAAVYIESVQ